MCRERLACATYKSVNSVQTSGATSVFLTNLFPALLTCFAIFCLVTANAWGIDCQSIYSADECSGGHPSGLRSFLGLIFLAVLVVMFFTLKEFRDAVCRYAFVMAMLFLPVWFVHQAFGTGGAIIYVICALVFISWREGRKNKEPDQRGIGQLASTSDPPPTEPPRKGALAQIATGITSAVIIGIVIILVRSFAPESASAPEKSPPPPALASVQPSPVRPSSAAPTPTPTQNASGAPQNEVKPPERNQSAEVPAMESRGIGTQTQGATISPDERYAELVNEKERQKYPLGTDEIVRCRMEIPKKTLGDEPDRQAWLKSLREAGEDEQKALVILSKAQCEGGK